MIECSKRDTCKNRDQRCHECNSLANVYDHHPCYSNLVDHVTFMERLEEIALSHDLQLIMQRTPIGCCFIFYFKHIQTQQYSPTSVSWDYYKEDIDVFIHRLNVLARDFKKELEHD